jgi:ribonuclease-3
MSTLQGEGQPIPAVAVAVDRVAELEARLGLTFTDQARALTALTHKSYVNEHREEAAEDNERLEFLGDAVVDLVVSHRLMERFPRAREGELSKMRAAVVDEAGLAAMARSLGLGWLLRLGRGEELTGGREKSSLLADAMEAVIAAVFLERGLPGAQALVDRSLEEAYARASAGTLDRDYKTQLQEVCQSRFRLSPRYRVTAEHGPDHDKVFEVEVAVKGEAMGAGTGRSKKDAEQVAACRALEALQRPEAVPSAEVAVEARAVASPPVSPPAAAVDWGALPEPEPRERAPAPSPSPPRVKRARPARAAQKAAKGVRDAKKAAKPKSRKSRAAKPKSRKSRAAKRPAPRRAKGR